MLNHNQKITPFLWFDSQTEEAVNFYISCFKNSKVVGIKRYPEGPMKGKVLTEVFELEGQRFMALDGGPYYNFSPAVSFFVVLENETEVDTLWSKLRADGKALMELQKYDWSEKYGWVQDKYGVSWQISVGRKDEVGQTITPSLLFVGKQHGKAEEAIQFYTAIFKNSAVAGILRYGEGEGEQPGTVKHGQFMLDGGVFMAMDSGLDHKYAFTGAISFYVNCGPQKEVDHFWNKLSDGGDIEMCGWLKDRYGVTWQIIPKTLIELMNDSDQAKAKRVMDAMLKMKKIVITDLEKAYSGS
jgi:predicted 3-demethylubiquinone-9 3-methyltransferase (glyoxalase superfamily)